MLLDKCSESIFKLLWARVRTIGYFFVCIFQVNTGRFMIRKLTDVWNGLKYVFEFIFNFQG